MHKKKDTSFLESFGEILKTACHQDEPPFCKVACPFHMDIISMLPKWEAGRWNAVYRTYQTSVAFPAIVSQICPAPCEASCILRERGGALALKELEKASVRLTKRKKPNAYNLPPKGKKAAIIGGGLSGLGCALRLCNKKYEVTVFEKAEQSGGHARTQMKAAVFDEEIQNQFQFEDPKILTGITVGKDIPFEEIVSQFDAVYVATGAGGDDFGLVSDPGGAFATTTPGVFMGGALTGADDVQALAEGLRAALALERYIKTALMNEPKDQTRTRLVLDPEMIPASPRMNPIDPDTGFLAEEVMREAARCRKCSCDICIQECDLMRIQQKTPGRLYEESYITVRPSTLANDGRWATRRIASCDQCGLCKTVCPQDIDMGEFLLQSHRGLKDTDAMPWAFHDYWLRDMEFSRTEALLVRPAPGQDKPGNAESVYAFFPGCQMAASDPRYVADSYDYLLRHCPNTALWMNCCGAPAAWAVEDELHEAHVNDLRNQWEQLGHPVVVFACPTCRKMFDHYLPDIPGIFLEERMVEWGLPEQAYAGQERGREEKTPSPGKYAVFDPCASREYPELQYAVRQLAGRLGVAFEELPYKGKRARCCSFGGQYSIAAPDYAKRVRMERAEESPLPYITYCSNCRDTFASRGKENVHILDLAFGRLDRRRETPTVTGRWDNRRKLRADLLRTYWGEETEGKEKAVTLLVEKELERKLSEQHILISDMEEVIAACEKTQGGIWNPDNGHITAHMKIQKFTYWAEYEPLPDGSFRLWNGYSHRMNLEGE